MIATYRLQLTPTFTFADAAEVLPYLKRLGISHVYLSPITESVAGSLHGYDVEDHNAIRKELGGEEGWGNFLKCLRKSSMKVILDFVPNHAGVGPKNEAWQNVLAHGQFSPSASYFDIDWNPLENSLKGKVLLPFLGRPYGECLDQGEIHLVWYGGSLRAAYGEQNFALSPESCSDILTVAMAHHERSELYFDLKELREAFQAVRPDDIPHAEMLQLRLKSLASELDWETILAEFSGERLHTLLEKQHWRLAYWKAASYETNYRRFFDVNGLVALRIQDSHVFSSTHRLLSSLIALDEVDGVRIDHVDGLFDPQAYLSRLREMGIRQIWVEKILAPGEILPAEWPVEGTTGYEFMNDVMNVLIDSQGLESISRIYDRFVPENLTFQDITREGKRLVMETSLSSELNRLAHELNDLCKSDYHTRDFALGALREALAELIAAIDRYRTYLPYDKPVAMTVVQAAMQRARRQTPSFEPSIYDFIFSVIFGRVAYDLLPSTQAWLGRFQQYCSAVAAKGVEDTSFYRYVPLLALNEVGGTPEIGTQPVQAFHSHAKFRTRSYPRNLLATATHDHKRGEDTRMRLIALSLAPDLWEETLRKLEGIAASHHLNGPSKQDRYLFFQTLVAIWETGDGDQLTQRIQEYLLKAVRESKRQTSWNHPNQDYENAVEKFVDSVLTHPELSEVLRPLCSTISHFGFQGSLCQLMLKLLSPGVPDFYQGRELMDLSLVDPDNRRPVDYRRRMQLLEQIQSLVHEPNIPEIHRLMEGHDEKLKLYMTTKLIKLRSELASVFDDGSYQELKLEGTGSEHWIAFARSSQGKTVLAIIPCLKALAADYRHVRIVLDEQYQGRTWKEFLTNSDIHATEIIDLHTLPLHWAVLVTNEVA